MHSDLMSFRNFIKLPNNFDKHKSQTHLKFGHIIRFALELLLNAAVRKIDSGRLEGHLPTD